MGRAKELALYVGVGLLSVPLLGLGVYAAVRPTSWFDYVVAAICGVLGALIFAFTLSAIWTTRRIWAVEDKLRRRGEARRSRKPSRVGRLLEARDFLPEEPPAGWSRPIALRGESMWKVETDTELIGLVLERETWMWAIKVFILPRTGKTPVSDARCAEILRHVQHVGEFIEGDEAPDCPEQRKWVAVAPGLRPRWRVPAAPPTPREHPLSPHLAAARKYLPQKLPAEWSVPVAITADHGTEWKDGAWMIGTSDERLMLVTLVTSKGRVKLSVSIFQPDGGEVSEGCAVEMLRHFRGVLEFAQTEPVVEDGVLIRAYLGELAPEGGARAMLN
jgi:hypothetical protein